MKIGATKQAALEQQWYYKPSANELFVSFFVFVFLLSGYPHMHLHVYIQSNENTSITQTKEIIVVMEVRE
jgi:hypothetical protein